MGRIILYIMENKHVWNHQPDDMNDRGCNRQTSVYNQLKGGCYYALPAMSLIWVNITRRQPTMKTGPKVNTWLYLKIGYMINQVVL